MNKKLFFLTALLVVASPTIQASDLAQNVESVGPLSVLTAASVSVAMRTAMVSVKASAFLAKLGISSTAFLAASIASLYFSSPNAHHPEHEGIKITINGKTFVHKKDATEWIFDVNELKPTRKRLIAATAAMGAAGALAAAYFDNKLVNAITLAMFLGMLASSGIVVGLEAAMNATDKE